MHRQDSGYESITPREGPSKSPGTSQRRAHSTHSSRTGSRTRPPTRRNAMSGSVNRLPKTAKYNSRSNLVHSGSPVTVIPSLYDNSIYQDSSPYSTRASDPTSYYPTSYFHFPSPDPHTTGDDAVLPNSASEHGFDASYDAPGNDDVYQTPPQTTHYWTSDQTRRLEYAAIDAASRGFKGWMMRHMVPDCFIPKAKRRITFDDDTGSVRRYRIELEAEESTEKECVSNMMRRGFKKSGSSRRS
ncbi:hypothetical protein SPBR_03211 [Sporothrix brasiliensis 5110]|uniref:Uncharacterized protein n=1 Tax=Sporothrix brasiliensis 5110 TaxID=1398154 RepID=A0A0C2J4S9_9PEZI|nr:uncharacterized protein SPBR_03211 [Sporothrix brasiliensis 5110]KIH92077.1 hypothetical protein SPBR_03211 [Sporothrix brasiliensis 5110]